MVKEGDSGIWSRSLGFGAFVLMVLAASQGSFSSTIATVSLLVGVGNILPGLAATIISARSAKDIRSGKKGRKYRLAGLIMGIIAMGLAAVVLIVIAFGALVLWLDSLGQ